MVFSIPGSLYCHGINSPPEEACLRTRNWCLQLKSEVSKWPWRKLALHPPALSQQQLWKHHVIHSAALHVETHNEKKKCGCFIWECQRQICFSISILGIINTTSFPPCIILTTLYLYIYYQSYSFVWFSSLVWDFQISMLITIFHGYFWWDYPLRICNAIWELFIFLTSQIDLKPLRVRDVLEVWKSFNLFGRAILL